MSKDYTHKVPKYLELTSNDSQSVQDSNLKAIIVATANKPEWAAEIVTRWNYYSDKKGK